MSLIFMLFFIGGNSVSARYPYSISQEEINASAHMYGTQEYGQSFTLANAGSISQIQISLRPLTYPANVTLHIYPDEGYSGPVFTQSYPVAAEGTILMELESPLKVNPGAYTFSVTPDENTFISMSTLNPYSEGTMISWDGSPLSENDLYFIIVMAEPVTAVGGFSTVPGSFVLEQNYPNPFNPVTMISFSLPGRMQATLGIFDIRGGELARLVDDVLDAGPHTVEWNASRIPAGVYIYRLQSEGIIRNGKCVLIK